MPRRKSDSRGRATGAGFGCAPNAGHGATTTASAQNQRRRSRSEVIACCRGSRSRFGELAVLTQVSWDARGKGDGESISVFEFQAFQHEVELANLFLYHA